GGGSVHGQQSDKRPGGAPDDRRAHAGPRGAGLQDDRHGRPRGHENAPHQARDSAPPVLMLTAMTDEPSTRAGFDAGVTDYVTKPFSIPQLTARVRACLARTQLLIA